MSELLFVCFASAFVGLMLAVIAICEIRNFCEKFGFRRELKNFAHAWRIRNETFARVTPVHYPCGTKYRVKVWIAGYGSSILHMRRSDSKHALRCVWNIEDLALDKRGSFGYYDLPADFERWQTDNAQKAVAMAQNVANFYFCWLEDTTANAKAVNSIFFPQGTK